MLLLRNVLPTTENLLKRHINFYFSCPFCNMECQSSLHVRKAAIMLGSSGLFLVLLQILFNMRLMMLGIGSSR